MAFKEVNLLISCPFQLFDFSKTAKSDTKCLTKATCTNHLCINCYALKYKQGTRFSENSRITKFLPHLIATNKVLGEAQCISILNTLLHPAAVQQIQQISNRYLQL